MQTQNNTKTCYQEETEKLDKNLSVTLQAEINLLMNKLKYTNNKRPFEPSLLNILEPSKLLLLSDCLESCFH